MSQAVEEFGAPIFGLIGPFAGEGVLNGHGVSPCRQLTLLYRIPDGRIEVTTGASPLGGTDNLVRNLVTRSIPTGIRLPWSITIDERLVTLPVDNTPTQFRLVEASTGDWLAAGGYKKRHLLLAGSSGTALDDLQLAPVALNFDD